MRHTIGFIKSKLPGCQRGLAAVEFALVAPVLALMLIVSVDFGMAYVEAQRLESAAHAGTQRLLHDPITAGDTTAVELQGLGEYFDRTVSDGERGGLPITASARNFCGCPSSGEVSCGTTCAGGDEAGTFVELILSGNAAMTLSYPFTGTSDITLTRSSIVRVQ